MSTIVNIIWFIFGGFFLGLSWVLAGLICMISIVGIPFGYACMRIARFAFFPFGKTLVPAEWVGESRIPGTSLMNIVWFLFVGIWLAIEELMAGISLCITLIGIPFGLAHFKLCLASFAPLGQRVVSSETAEHLRRVHL